MNKYSQKILDALLNKYEKSVLSKQGSKRKLRIHVLIQQLFPRYDNSDYYNEHLLIDESCFHLRDLHIVSLICDDEGIVDVDLVLDHIQHAYQIAHRTFTAHHRTRMLTMLQEMTMTTEWLEAFRLDMIEKLEHFQSIHKYLNIDDETETKEILQVLNALPLQQQEISFRKFSLAVLKDSKRLEIIKTRIVHIIRNYYQEEFENEDDVFAYFNIMKNPGFLYIRGHMKIEIHQQVIDIGQLGGPFSLTTENIQHLHILDIQDHYLLTIENLTSFYDTVLDDTLVIYLGGYHNALRRALLTKIYQFQPHLQFYHFGDIDAGGFYIYLHLKERTKIPFQMLAMDQQTLERYQKYTKSLTAHDRRRLKKLKEIFPLEIFDYMLEHNCKLEQEIVDVHTYFDK